MRLVVSTVAEVKTGEGRVGLTPAGADALVRDGHEVLVEAGAGVTAGLPDADYVAAGARVVDRDEAWGAADLVVKVKEPVATEYRMLREDLVLFTYLHLAADEPLTRALVDAGTTAVAFETVERGGRLPLLAPMSAVAGRLAAQAGAHHLTTHAGGRGTLLGPVAGVRPARVVVIGGGVVGTNAAEVALGLGAQVTLFDASLDRLAELHHALRGRIELAMANPMDVARAVADADLVIGAVLVPGARAPHVITREAVAGMAPGTVVCDVSIDQGGCVETARPTSHDEPVFVDEGVVHYCVTNMPGAVPRTSTLALANATLPYVRELAGAARPWNVRADSALGRGLNIVGGRVVHAAVAEAHGMRHEPLGTVAA
jgi:alanine dehydrogenase